MASPVEFEGKKHREDIQDVPWQKVYRRVFVAGDRATLATMNLERGDSLPENSSAEIVTAHITTDSKTAARVAVVTAVELVAES